MLKFYFWFLFLNFGNDAVAQSSKPFAISGTVRDQQTGETIIGATVTLKAEKASNTLSNAYGFYSFSMVAGSYQMITSFTGYTPDTMAVQVTNDLVVNIGLIPRSAGLDEVIVTSKRQGEYIAKSIMGVDKLNMAEINRMPVLLGERDVLKTIQLMPGYKPAGEGSSGFNVRGGGTDQNLILLDEAPVYNASHLFGFFSTFNSDAIKDVSVYKGGMPAQYGGRLSSVVDIKMKDGNSKALDVEGGLGLIASRLSISAPIVKDKGSFMVSGRRTYADAVLGLIKDTGQGKQNLFFYDLNLKANYTLGKKDRVYLSGYFGRDELVLGKNFATNWGNKTGTLRWNHVFGNRLFSNTSFMYSNFDYQVKADVGGTSFNIISEIEDLNFKQDFDWNVSNKSKLRFGLNGIYHTIAPGSVTTNNATGGIASPVQTRYSVECATYFSHEWKANDRFEMIYGARLSSIDVLGGGSFSTYDKNGNILSTKTYKKSEKVVSYLNVEPRFSASYNVSARSTAKVSYNRNVQNLHLLTNATSNAPYDVWLQSTNNIKPEIADQVALGYYLKLNQGKYEFSTEVYYKALQNQVDYRNAAVILGNDNVERELLYGTGRAYGAEFLLRKKTGRWKGWVGYTLSKVEKKIDGINDGRYFNARQDRPHDVSIVAMYDLSSKWSFSSNWVYTSGIAVTLPTGKYEANGQTVFLYDGRNQERFPAYHRLDVSATYEPGKHKERKYKSSWVFSLYNAYGRANAFAINFRDKKGDATQTEAVQTTLFTFVPGVTWNFKF